MYRLAMAPKPEELHGSSATQYDDLCQSMECHAQEVLFGLAYEYVFPGQKLLDIGIGTGLSASLFHKAGLEICGLDFSEDMLRVCAKKGIARELKVCDLSQDFLPYPDGDFHHVSSCGVFHFLEDLNAVFGEVQRVMKPGGTFSFTTKDIQDGNAEYVDPGSEIEIYCHDRSKINMLANRHHFQQLKWLTFYMYDDLEKDKRSLFTAHVLKKIGQ